VTLPVAGRRRLSPGWPLPAVALIVWIATYAVAFRSRPALPRMPALYVLYGVPYLAFVAVGALIIRSQRGSRVGWVMAGIGLLQGLGTLSGEVERQLAGGPSRGLAGWLLVASAPVNVAATGLIVVLLLVFPDGRLASPRWRPFLGTIGVLLVAVVVFQLTSPVPPPDVPGLPVSPLAAPAVAAALAPVTSFWTFPVALLVAAASLVARYRRGDVMVRQQIKWLALATVVLAVCEAGNIALAEIALSGVLDAVGKLAVVAAVGIAVLRHRLYDVDLAISRTLAYGWLAVLVTAIYVALVVGVGSAVGHPAGPDLLLSLIATVVVALVSLPLRSRLQELANRLVYGRRQAPYESLAGFTRRLADRYAIGDVLPDVAAALGEGLRARAAVIRLYHHSTLTAAETWPAGSEPPEVAPDASVPISHQGTVLGALAVWTGNPLTDAEQRLLADLGVQAGLVVHNAALTAELEERLHELRASRLRLVAAQDAERRRFERDLHDGAQQDLVSVRMTLGEAERLAAGTDPRLAALLGQAQEHTAATLESIRGLSRGLYPPLLQSHGLVPALVAHARRLPLPAQVHGTDRRFSAEVETAIYFCCVEALQNAVKHAAAGRLRIAVEATAESVCFEVTDDGRGFAPDRSAGGSGLENMTDRVEALGGRIEVRSGGTGTSVRGCLPVGQVTRTSGIVEVSSTSYGVPR
jgi:signal transduction histidine kinase